MLDNRMLSGFESSKVRSLLAYLIVECGRAHSREELAGLLWPEASEVSARQNLRQALANLRKTIGDPYLRVRRGEIEFNREGHYWLDVNEFNTLIRDTQLHRHRYAPGCPICMQKMDCAVNLYLGDFLDGFFVEGSGAFQDWLLLQRERYHQQVISLLEWLADYHQRCGEYNLALDYRQKQVRLDPWREEAQQDLMRLLALSGQRSAALHQYQVCRKILMDELGVEPTRQTTELYERIRSGASLPLIPLPEINLPTPLTSFIGRDEELDELINDLFDPDTRLLTLVGPGGVGKTRLALQAAILSLSQFPDGVHFVPLASLSSTRYFVSALAKALRISFHEQGDPSAQLLEYLSEKQLLLVLDGFEHLLEGVNLLVRLLKRAPGIVLLVTSRKPLGLQVEQLFPLGGLRLPDKKAMGLGSKESGEAFVLNHFSALQLFIERARLVKRDFSPEENLAALIHICQLVDGLPLAIELAAAWVRKHPLTFIVTELEHGLDLLVTTSGDMDERHRSMRAVLAQTWEMLLDEERVVFCQLSVFRGDFDLEAAKEVCGAAAEMLESFVEGSLLRRHSDGRYEMHELWQQYAAESLSTNSIEHLEVEKRHSRYYANVLERCCHEVRAGDPATLERLGKEFENLWTGWERSMMAGILQQVMLYVESLVCYLRRQNRYLELVDLLERSLDWLRGFDGKTIAKKDGGKPTHLGEVTFFPRTLSRKRLLEADWQRHLGEAYYCLGRMPESRSSLLHVLKLLEQPLLDNSLATSLGLGFQLLRQALHRLLPRRLLGRTPLARQNAVLQAARACERLGQIYYFMDQAAPASYYSVLGLNLAESAPPSAELARLYANTSMAMALVPFQRLAKHYIELGLKVAYKVGHPLALAWVLELSSVYYCGVGRWQDVEQNAGRAAEIYLDLGDLRRWEECLVTLSSCKHFTGHIEQSLEICRQMHTSARARSDLQVQRWALSGMAENHLYCDRMEEAAELAQSALELEGGVEDYTTDVGCHGVLAVARMRQGQQQEALTAAEVACDILGQMSPASYSSLEGYARVTETFLRLWQVNVAQGGDWPGVERIEEKARWACTALERFARVFPIAQPRSLLWLGVLQQMDNRLLKAHSTWRKGLAVAERMGMPYEIKLIRQEIQSAGL
jgi:predicted ATPase/DNA-binding SARP family transcriptional activator